MVAVLFSLIGAFYYLRVVKLMYFDAPTDARADRRRAPTSGVLMSANGLAVLVFGLAPGCCSLAICRTRNTSFRL